MASPWSNILTVSVLGMTLANQCPGDKLKDEERPAAAMEHLAAVVRSECRRRRWSRRALEYWRPLTCLIHAMRVLNRMPPIAWRFAEWLATMVALCLLFLHINGSHFVRGRAGRVSRVGASEASRPAPSPPSARRTTSHRQSSRSREA